MVAAHKNLWNVSSFFSIFIEEVTIICFESQKICAHSNRYILSQPYVTKLSIYCSCLLINFSFSLYERLSAEFLKHLHNVFPLNKNVAWSSPFESFPVSYSLISLSKLILLAQQTQILC